MKRNKIDINDYIGSTFNYLTILSLHSEVRKNNQTIRLVNCLCKCGKTTTKNFSTIKRGHTRSCGCLVKEVQTKVGYEKRFKSVTPGDKFGILTVLCEIENTYPRKVTCTCSCGVEKTYLLNNLFKGCTTSCGCLRSEYSKQAGLRKRKVHINPGDVFSRLTVLKEMDGVRYRDGGKIHRLFECKCECGNIKTVQMRNLLIGKTNSCGCYLKERQKETCTKHSLYKTSEYKTWQAIKQRCYNPKTPHYSYYGGRGLTVCARWLESPVNFYEDMGPKPSPSHSIDRIDNYKLIDAYSKENCRWASKKEQVLNRRIMNKPD